jgi:hypothetical protein
MQDIPKCNFVRFRYKCWGYVVAIRSGMSYIGLNAPRLAGGTICYFVEIIGAIFLILGIS